MTDQLQKLTAPSAQRNQVPIGEQLDVLLPENAHVLEIAAGTGQHGAYFTQLRPDIVWQYSDIDIEAMGSQRAYVGENPEQLLSPISVDVTANNWWHGITDISVVYCANMIHIAPWAAAKGLAQGAGALLATNGQFILYGPFLLGRDSAQSNLNFDQNLKHRNPAWGVREIRDVETLFRRHGLVLQRIIPMPRDNFLLVFSTI